MNAGAYINEVKQMCSISVYFYNVRKDCVVYFSLVVVILEVENKATCQVGSEG